MELLGHLLGLLSSVVGLLVLDMLRRLRKDIEWLWQAREQDRRHCEELHTEIAKELGYLKRNAENRQR